jgi:desulfoferrodoxin (superoxide reductase-like protein)
VALQTVSCLTKKPQSAYTSRESLPSTMMRYLLAFVLSWGLATPFSTAPRTVAFRPGRVTCLATKNLDDAGELVTSRRRALQTVVVQGSLLAAALASGAPPSFAESVAATVSELEKLNLDTVNTIGAPEKHLPQVSVSDDGTVTVVVPHVMDPEKPHWIQAVWLKDEGTGNVAAAEMFLATSASPPSISYAGASTGTKLTPLLFCNLHGLWRGDTITV